MLYINITEVKNISGIDILKSVAHTVVDLLNFAIIALLQ